MRKINVLVVDDSAFMRKVITDLINLDDELNVIDTARNGEEAVKKIKDLSPDIVTMDVEMPIMDGITALKIIMKQSPLPVVMLSSLTKEGADATLNALELGAVDFITKPKNIFKMNNDDIKKQLIEKIKMASKVNVNLNNINNFNDVKRISSFNVVSRENSQIKKIVAIGTSTGGPRALQHVIPYLPKNIAASILIVQHMPAGFTKSLADRLNNLSQINVKEAEDNEILLPGYAYIAPGGYHLKIIKTANKHKIKLTKDTPVSGHRPSVDVMMNSLAQLKLNNLIGVIMTGMGSDGAEGMKNIKLQNGYTIAQDEETCVVYGMPKSAIKLGCIDEVVPIQDIAATITKIVGV
ncbi:chemotaxis response regulator protein-glutamate methylesterase [Crassaminicella thermophila]|uniref:Protein-glutamate methylesterase/protein-glutamine glutaminase n=1 Tax=Crassaminicella thermophila TaxID=2599308 RepID=A0A5C0SFW1_CRATE|nr:chemotaxis response regulator protein-glutamate methylesterase [Crassaminicella thermophila]QEK12254.1 chemotaxis response regulator protein-glutamate methylesterase [Crassaminicella thermophila]